MKNLDLVKIGNYVAYSAKNFQIHDAILQECFDNLNEAIEYANKYSYGVGKISNIIDDKIIWSPIDKNGNYISVI